MNWSEKYYKGLNNNQHRINNEWFKSMLKYLKDNGIYTTFRYYPLHMVDYFKEYKVSLPITEKVMNNTLLLPIHQSLSKRDTKKIVNKIREFYEKS